MVKKFCYEFKESVLDYDKKLVDYLKINNITTVAMKSTGSYWHLYFFYYKKKYLKLFWQEKSLAKNKFPIVIIE